MKKSILRSIKPYWVYLILKGTKTIEIGKQKPKSLDWDGKVYIYCSKDKKSFNQIPEEDREEFKKYLGKVVAVFDCNCITEDEFYMTRYLHSFYEKACLSHTQVKEYGQGKTLYGWHISNLKVFDMPKDLDEFCTKSCSYLKNKVCYCSESCIYKEVNTSGDISLCITPLERPPQSYCFVQQKSPSRTFRRKIIMSCNNCGFARRACNEEYIGCAYWENKRQGDYDIGEDPMTDNEIMDELSINSFSTGWVYLGRYPEQEKAPDSIASCNMMTNGVICFKKSFSCNKFKMRA